MGHVYRLPTREKPFKQVPKDWPKPCLSGDGLICRCRLRIRRRI